MPQLYHENREEQMNKKIHGMAPLQHEKEPYLRSQSMQTENILREDAAHHHSIQLLAYRIHCEKGGAELDNWLEAERILRNDYHK